ncbi:MAG: hypothetical protein S4CHLAM20_10610 [Chlamydiia bacterium]|nr:hypothetical protein [Chlamydiia bacterium]
MLENKSYKGSFSELLRLTFPLMLFWISTSLAMFVDRLFLSHYSLEALGAAVNAGTMAWGITYGLQIFAEMSQVVIAQYQGAQKNDKLSHPVWQMLWVVSFSFIFFLPIAILGSKFFFATGSFQSSYFMWFIIFGPAFGLIGACSAYFIGRGENYIVTISAVIGNLVNLILDYFMIFGIKGVLSPMGVKGAAIATGIGMSVQGLGLLWLFLKRTDFKVISFSYEELKPCLRVGIPPGLFMTAELIGWGIFFSMMAKAGYVHLTVTSLCHSIVPLLACAGLGLQKSVATISGNLIGAEKKYLISQVVQKALILLSVYIFIVASIMYLFPSKIINLFQNNQIDTELFNLLQIGFLLSILYLFFGGIRSIFTGVLSAAGDSRFLMIAGSLTVWVFLLLPTYYLVILNLGSVTFAQTILVFYGLIASIIYFTRYRIGSWSKSAALL